MTESLEYSTFEELCKFVTPIAHPLATEKVNTRILKLVKKAYKMKTLKIGIKAVQKAIRKGERGIIILAGDTTPIDIISHMPILCEDKELPYIFTPSKNELGASFGSKRSTCAVLINMDSKYAKLYEKIALNIKKIPMPE
ncbi:unnamed protein product [Gordionus sp. m RMFG-2023]|uniref:H/ACA ribonucleoprotein complex subunit 2-like n=1 Tax=Gordionus sp. m RMFG-2023 TaxID=3053472 RepID=UPI0030E0A043